MMFYLPNIFVVKRCPNIWKCLYVLDSINTHYLTLYLSYTGRHGLAQISGNIWLPPPPPHLGHNHLLPPLQVPHQGHG